MSDKISEKLKDVEARFNKIDEEAKNIQEQVNVGNRELAARREEMVRLQGEFRALKSLENTETNVEGLDVSKPVKKEKKEKKTK